MRARYFLFLISFPLSSWAGQLCFSDGHCINDPSITGDPDAQRAEAASLPRDPEVGLGTGAGYGQFYGNQTISVSFGPDLLVTPDTERTRPADPIINTTADVGPITAAPPAPAPAVAEAAPVPAPAPAPAPASAAETPPRRQPPPAPAAEGEAADAVARQCTAEQAQAERERRCNKGRFETVMRQCLRERSERTTEACIQGAETRAATEAIEGAVAAAGEGAGANGGAVMGRDASLRAAGANCGYARSCETAAQACMADCREAQEIREACAQIAPSPTPSQPPADLDARVREAIEVVNSFGSQQAQYDRSARLCGETAPARFNQARRQAAGELEAAYEAERAQRQTGGQHQGGPMQGMGEMLSSIMQLARQNEQKNEQQQQQQTVDLCASAAMASTRECRCRGLTDAQCSNVMAGSSPLQQGGRPPSMPADPRLPASASGY